MENRTINTPIEKPNYTGFWRRGAAMWIDTLAYNLIIILPGLLLSLIFSPLLASLPPEGLTLKLWHLLNDTVALVWSIGVYFAYFAWFDCNHFGQTPGRQCLGIILTSLNDQPITLKQSLIRQLGKLVSALVLGVGYKVQPFTPKKQAWHDMWSQTIVVTEDTGPCWVVWLINLAGFGACLGWMAYFMLTTVMPMVLSLTQ